jgi:hypothetical protein
MRVLLSISYANAVRCVHTTINGLPLLVRRSYTHTLTACLTATLLLLLHQQVVEAALVPTIWQRPVLVDFVMSHCRAQDYATGDPHSYYCDRCIRSLLTHLTHTHHTAATNV